MKELIQQYVNYNLWANKRIGDLLISIDKQLLDKEVKSSFPSIRKTVHHIWDAELIWLSRLKGLITTWPPTAKYTNPAITDFIKTSEEFTKYVQLKEENYLNLLTSYKDSKGNEHGNINYGIIMHCMNHSTFHRGQIITLLREVGITNLKSTDLISYLRENK